MTTAHGYTSVRRHGGEVTVIVEYTFRGADLTTAAVDRHFADAVRTEARRLAEQAADTLSELEEQRSEQMRTALDAALEAVDPAQRDAVAARFQAAT